MKPTSPSKDLLSAALHLLAGFLALFSATSIQAAVLVSYDMQNAANRALPSFLDGNVTATSLTGNNLNVFGSVQNPSGNFYTTWPTSIGSGAANTVADALVTNCYMTLTLTPVAGNTITLTSLSFDLFAATAGPSARQLYVFSDKTGFTDVSSLLSASTVSGSPLIPYNTSPGQNYSIDLSGFTALANFSDSVTFRFYEQTPNAAQSLAFDNITINGTVTSVPEPSYTAILGLGLFVLLAARRLRRPA